MGVVADIDSHQTEDAGMRESVWLALAEVTRYAGALNMARNSLRFARALGTDQRALRAIKLAEDVEMAELTRLMPAMLIIGEHCGVSEDDLWTAQIRAKDGEIHIYYGGNEEAHGHIIYDVDGVMRYRREPHEPHGPHNHVRRFEATQPGQSKVVDQRLRVA